MIILDTHIFLWMNTRYDQIPSRIADAIKNEAVLGLASISLWELAMLNQYGRIVIPNPSLAAWFSTVLEAGKIRVLPLTPEIAVRSGALEIHGDPADRIIAATALEHNCPLATVDRRLVAMPDLIIV